MRTLYTTRDEEEVFFSFSVTRGLAFFSSVKMRTSEDSESAIFHHAKKNNTNDFGSTNYRTSVLELYWLGGHDDIFKKLQSVDWPLWYL